MHEPRHAARDAQLRHADHRAARSRAEPAHDAPAARLGDPRLHDRVDRAAPQRGAALRSVRPEERLRARLHRLLARLARRGLRRQRDAADPLARSCRGSAARSSSRTPARSSPTRSREGARPRDGDERDGRRGRARHRPGARRRARRDRVALGLLVQRPARPDRLRVGLARAARDVRTERGARTRSHRHGDLRRRADRARLRDLEGRPERLEPPDRDRRLRARGRAPARVPADRATRPRADARPPHVPEPALRRCIGDGVPERLRALRADVPVRLLLPGAAGAVADHGGARARAARDRHARRIAARRHRRRPPRLARPLCARDAAERRRPRRDDDAAGAHLLLVERALA